MRNNNLAPHHQLHLLSDQTEAQECCFHCELCSRPLGFKVKVLQKEQGWFKSGNKSISSQHATNYCGFDISNKSLLLFCFYWRVSGANHLLRGWCPAVTNNSMLPPCVVLLLLKRRKKETGSALVGLSAWVNIYHWILNWRRWKWFSLQVAHPFLLVVNTAVKDSLYV